jgi:hypothetical protein
MTSKDIVTLSSPAGQTRWSSYVVEGGRVYANGSRDTSSPLVSLPSHLAPAGGPPGSRMEDRMSALLTFYGAFGFLAPTDRPLPAKGRRRRSVRSSESIAWALRHAWTVQTVMALYQAMGQTDAGGRLVQDRLDALLSSVTHRRAVRVRAWRGPDAHDLDTPGQFIVPRPREEDGMQPVHLVRAAEESALAFSRRIIAALITPNLARVRRIYDSDSGVPRFVFDRLVDVVYWQLADALTASDLRQCPCGQVFFAQDKRQQVCPPLPGQRESLCGRRFRMRRWRTR